MHETDQYARDVTPMTDLITDILPYMAKVDLCWKDVTNDVSFRSSQTHKDMLAYLRNQFRRNGSYLDKKLSDERVLKSHHEESQDPYSTPELDKQTEVAAPK